MMHIEPEFIYLPDVTIRTLREVILDKRLNGDDEILVNTIVYLRLVEEFRETYNEPVTSLELLGITISENRLNYIPNHNIGVIRG